MEAIKTFSDRRPLVFAFLILLSWLLLGALLVGGSTALLGLPIIEDVPQMVGTLGSVLILLLITWRLGWLKSIGITRLGDWKAWLITIPLLLYLVFAYSYGFFGDLSFDPRIFSRSETARQLLLRQGIVGFVEETLFRGLIFYVLLKTWGKTKRGLILSVIVQAFIFGAVHLLQVAGGGSLGTALVVVVNGIISGIWWAVLVLNWKSLWQAILLHSLSNLFVQVKSLSSAALEPALLAYGRATLFELPLAALGIWLLLKMPLDRSLEDKPER
ncbi:MAG: CPBP family intramembrane glutamic endopeptidase [Anaerolineales bacterium]